ncbi:carboxypeptidase N subunit 2-like [Saccostrea echinata]|uniref:carboxypeptidase N subunit 2-like n=1 Tax=Saccostrea echinata TaxID=191078 RepID=UPI002A82E74A|nr:carboxypeptidase N subunit 2-like [Saccostrea echinata]
MAVTKHLVVLGLLFFFTDGKKCPTDCFCFEEEIDCSQNQLLEIPGEIPQSARSLKMNFNFVTTLDAKITQPLRNLRTLDLHSNKIHVIKVGTFVGWNSLEKLVISKNVLKSLNKKTFFQMNKLRTLILSDNLIEKIDGAISHLTSLEMLDLSGNRLTQLTAESFVNLPKLKNLILKQNDIISIAKETFTSLPSLAVLDIGNNPLISIDGLLSSNSQLSKIDVKNCQLENFPTGLPRSVIFIDASGNNLTRIDKDAMTSDPMILTLKDNMITEIEDGAFSRLRRLSKLELQNNNLTRIPTIPKSVHHLNLQNNNIDHMDATSFPENSTLEELFIHRNLISNITQNVFQNICKLKKLSIGDNLFQNLSYRLFYRVQNLTYLNIDKIHIEEISNNVFDNLNNLLTLSMSGITNSKTSIRGNFLQPLSKVETLNLKNSPGLAKFLLESGEMQRSLQYVSNLNLAANNLTTLPPGIMRCLPFLDYLNISDNKFHCDQRLAWLGQWINIDSSKFTEPDRIVCSTPKQLYGQAIGQMKNSDFVPTTTISLSDTNNDNTEIFFPTEKPPNQGSRSDKQSPSAASTNNQFITLTVSVSVFIILVAVGFVIFLVCRQSRGLVYNRSTIINHPPPVNFFISNEENAPVPPPAKLTRQDRSSVTSQTSRDITSEDQGVKIYTWSG